MSLLRLLLLILLLGCFGQTRPDTRPASANVRSIFSGVSIRAIPAVARIDLPWTSLPLRSTTVTTVACKQAIARELLGTAAARLAAQLRASQHALLDALTATSSGCDGPPPTTAAGERGAEITPESR